MFKENIEQHRSIDASRNSNRVTTPKEYGESKKYKKNSKKLKCRRIK